MLLKAVPGVKVVTLMRNLGNLPALAQTVGSAVQAWAMITMKPVMVQIM